jgi:hypothetical protein
VQEPGGIDPMNMPSLSRTKAPPTSTPSSDPTVAHPQVLQLLHLQPTSTPSSDPTAAPSSGPTTAPSSGLTAAPSSSPTTAPSSGLTAAPSTATPSF